MKQVVVIEDEIMFRDFITKLVQDSPMLELAGETGDGIEGYDLITRLKPEMAMSKVAEGQTYLSPSVSDILRTMMLNPEQVQSIDELSNREREILQLIAESNSNKEIAAKLGISVKTAETHRQRIISKLDIHDTAGLTRYAILNGLAELSM